MQRGVDVNFSAMIYINYLFDLTRTSGIVVPFLLESVELVRNSS